MAERVLVTGASGCIGRALVPQLLERGWTVHATSSRTGAQGDERAVWHRADLLVPGEAERVLRAVRPSALVHLAWYIAPGRWAAAPDNVDWVRASLELVQAFCRIGGRRVVVAGSGLEYDWSFGYCSEERTPRVPHTLYGAAKHALHTVLEPYARQAGVGLGWARVFFLYGPHEHPERLVASVARSLLLGEPARVSHGRQVRDYLHVADVAGALLALLESEVEGPINVASGQPVTLRAIVERVGELLGRSHLVQFGTIPAAPTDVPLVVADVSRLSTLLGWAPRLTLDEGLDHTIGWWREVLGREVVS
jgi:nucleoside-diphosphate-sugar epimerase